MSDCQGKGLVAFHMGTDRHWIISSNGFGHQKVGTVNLIRFLNPTAVE